MGGQKNTKNVGHHLCTFPKSKQFDIYLNSDFSTFTVGILHLTSELFKNLLGTLVGKAAGCRIYLPSRSRRFKNSNWRNQMVVEFIRNSSRILLPFASLTNIPIEIVENISGQNFFREIEFRSQKQQGSSIIVWNKRMGQEFFQK